MIAKFFIERPVLANVIALLMLLLGAVAILGLPVAQYPQLTPPTIQVTTAYPGASARTVQEVVARAIEQQVNGVEGMLYMQSNSSNDGRYALTISFAVGTNADQAQVAVQNRVAIALPLLPSAVQQQGVVTKKKSTAILQIVTLTSDDPQHDGLFLSNFANLRLRDSLARLPGVADVNVFGMGQYSMRVWLDAAQMRQRGLNPANVVSIINKQNQRISAGQIGAPPNSGPQDLQLTINVDTPLSDPAQFGDLIVSNDGSGSVVRLRDVARSQARFVQRSPGTGTRVLLDDLLAQDQLTVDDLHNWPDEEPSHTALAEAIASGRCDVGLGIESTARARGLGFVPLVQEQFHLVCLKSALDTPATQALRSLLQTPAWQDTLNTLPGYQAQGSGHVQSLSQQLPWWTFKQAKKTRNPQ